MATKAEAKQNAERQFEEDRALRAVIGKHVLDSLGEPGELHKLEVRHLWKDNYRVNVIVGENATSVRVAHSYFLVTDGNGKVINSEPKITRLYQPRRLA